MHGFINYYSQERLVDFITKCPPRYVVFSPLLSQRD